MCQPPCLQFTFNYQEPNHSQYLPCNRPLTSFSHCVSKSWQSFTCIVFFCSQLHVWNLFSVWEQQRSSLVNFLFKTLQGLIEFSLSLGVRTRILCMVLQSASWGGPFHLLAFSCHGSLYQHQPPCGCFSLGPLYIFSPYTLLSSSIVICFLPRAFLNLSILIGLPWLFLFSSSPSPLCFPTTFFLFYYAFLTGLWIHLADCFQPFWAQDGSLGLLCLLLNPKQKTMSITSCTHKRANRWDFTLWAQQKI